MKLNADSEVLTRVRWFEVNPAARPLKFPTAFNSRIWLTDKGREYPVGERKGSKRPYRKCQCCVSKMLPVAPFGAPRVFQSGAVATDPRTRPFTRLCLDPKTELGVRLNCRVAHVTRIEQEIEILFLDPVDIGRGLSQLLRMIIRSRKTVPVPPAPPHLPRLPIEPRVPVPPPGPIRELPRIPMRPRVPVPPRVPDPIRPRVPIQPKVPAPIRPRVPVPARVPQTVDVEFLDRGAPSLSPRSLPAFLLAGPLSHADPVEQPPRSSSVTSPVGVRLVAQAPFPVPFGVRLVGTLGDVARPRTTVVTLPAIGGSVTAVVHNRAPVPVGAESGQRLSGIVRQSAPVVAVEDLGGSVTAVVHNRAPVVAVEDLGGRVTAVVHNRAPVPAAINAGQRLSAVRPAPSATAPLKMGVRLSTIVHDLPTVSALLGSGYYQRQSSADRVRLLVGVEERVTVGSGGPTPSYTGCVALGTTFNEWESSASGATGGFTYVNTPRILTATTGCHWETSAFSPYLKFEQSLMGGWQVSYQGSGGEFATWAAATVSATTANTFTLSSSFGSGSCPATITLTPHA